MTHADLLACYATDLTGARQSLLAAMCDGSPPSVLDRLAGQVVAIEAELAGVLTDTPAGEEC